MIYGIKLRLTREQRLSRVGFSSVNKSIYFPGDYSPWIVGIFYYMCNIEIRTCCLGLLSLVVIGFQVRKLSSKYSTGVSKTGVPQHY